MILATVSTGSYTYTVLVRKVGDAPPLLLKAYERHCEQVPDADPEIMRLLIEGEAVDYTKMPTGVVLRDGSELR